MSSVLFSFLFFLLSLFKICFLNTEALGFGELSRFVLPACAPLLMLWEQQQRIQPHGSHSGAPCWKSP